MQHQEIEISAEGMTIWDGERMVASYTPLDAEITGRMIEKLAAIEPSLRAVGDAAAQASVQFSPPTSSYTDEQFQEKMEEAEAIGHAIGVEKGFADAIDQVTELIVEYLSDGRPMETAGGGIFVDLGLMKPTSDEGDK